MPCCVRVKGTRGNLGVNRAGRMLTASMEDER